MVWTQSGRQPYTGGRRQRLCSRPRACQRAGHAKWRITHLLRTQVITQASQNPEIRHQDTTLRWLPLSLATAGCGCSCPCVKRPPPRAVLAEAVGEDGSQAGTVGCCVWRWSGESAGEAREVVAAGCVGRSCCPAPECRLLQLQRNSHAAEETNQCGTPAQGAQTLEKEGGARGRGAAAGRGASCPGGPAACIE
jgi:hypothetical protein